MGLSWNLYGRIFFSLIYISNDKLIKASFYFKIRLPKIESIIISVQTTTKNIIVVKSIVIKKLI